jgi:hypothetical protein
MVRGPSTACWIVLAILTPALAHAQAGASAEAATELRAGFALRKERRFAEALPHLETSHRLMPQVKALLNMADCEEHLGRLLAAEQHWLEARDLAAAKGDDAARDEASERLQAIEGRIPRVTVILANGSPASASVTLDGAPVAGPWLGVALPSEPGRHVVEALAVGFETARAEVDLAERQSVRIELSLLPLPPSHEAAAIPEEHARPAPLVATSERAPDSAKPAARLPRGSARGGSVPLLYVGLGVTGLGLAGIGLGAIEGLAAQQDHASAVGACNGSGCPVAAQLLQANANNEATIATVSFVTGGLLAAGGGLVIWLATRSSPPATGASSVGTVRVTVAPLVGPRNEGLVLNIAF